MPATGCKLSVDAVAGTEGGETIRLRALVGNQVHILLSQNPLQTELDARFLLPQLYLLKWQMEK
jgi:hypothetical protein